MKVEFGSGMHGWLNTKSLLLLYKRKSKKKKLENFCYTKDS